jgi:hypothetical protein
MSEPYHSTTHTAAPYPLIVELGCFNLPNGADSIGFRAFDMHVRASGYPSIDEGREIVRQVEPISHVEKRSMFLSYMYIKSYVFTTYWPRFTGTAIDLQMARQHRVVTPPCFRDFTTRSSPSSLEDERAYVFNTHGLFFSYSSQVALAAIHSTRQTLCHGHPRLQATSSHSDGTSGSRPHPLYRYSRCCSMSVRIKSRQFE